MTQICIVPSYRSERDFLWLSVLFLSPLVNFSNGHKKVVSFPATPFCFSCRPRERVETPFPLTQSHSIIPRALACRDREWIEIEVGGMERASDSEVPPGGALPQQKMEDAAGEGPLIRVRVCHGSSQHEVSVPPQSTFGELKKVLAQEMQLEPEGQRLFFRGKQKGDDEYLNMAGVKDRAKLLLLEDPSSKERKLEEMKRDQEVARACDDIAHVRAEVEKLVAKVSALEASVQAGVKMEEKEFEVLTELLMVQLLKLDGIEAEGEAKVQRKNEVRRIQSFVETLDSLKGRNSNPFGSSNNVVSVTTQWETFEPASLGSLNAPPQRASSTTITSDWESFD